MSHGFFIISCFSCCHSCLFCHCYILYWDQTPFSQHTFPFFPTAGVSLVSETWSTLKNSFPAIDEAITKMQSKLRWESIFSLELSVMAVSLLLPRLSMIYRKFPVVPITTVNVELPKSRFAGSLLLHADLTLSQILFSLIAIWVMMY